MFCTKCGREITDDSAFCRKAAFPGTALPDHKRVSSVSVPPDTRTTQGNRKGSSGDDPDLFLGTVRFRLPAVSECAGQRQGVPGTETFGVSGGCQRGRRRLTHSYNNQGFNNSDSEALDFQCDKGGPVCPPLSKESLVIEPLFIV